MKEKKLFFKKERFLFFGGKNSLRERETLKNIECEDCHKRERKYYKFLESKRAALSLKYIIQYCKICLGMKLN